MKKLGFGLMRLPMKDNNVDTSKVSKMVDEFMSRGFTYFDTAWMYCGGNSEIAIKECLVDRYPRDSYTLTDKMPSFEIKSLEDRNRVFNKQLEKTGLTYFDYYWLHAVSRKNINEFDCNKCWEYLSEQKAKGLVKHIGFSFHDDAEFLDDLLNKHPEIEFVQLQLNYLDWLSPGVQSKACYDVCVKHNKKVIVMEPVKGGALAKLPDAAEKMFKDYDSNLSIASWAIRFAASLDNVYMVLSGMTTFGQMKDNLSYMEDFKPLTSEENNMCLKAAEIIKENVIVPCTGCEYCISVCPIGMPIPKLFSLYNIDKQDHNAQGWTTQGSYYNSLQLKGPKVDECLDCGTCENICPQHISIRKYLKEVKQHFEGEK